MESCPPEAPARPRPPASAGRAVVAGLAGLAGLAVLALVGATSGSALSAGDDAVEISVSSRPVRTGWPEAPAARVELVDPLAAPDAYLVAALGDPVDRVLDRLGPPGTSLAGVGGTVHTWRPSAGAEVTVRGWDDGGREVNGFFARVAPGQDGRLAVDGVVVGTTTLRSAVAAWGPRYHPAHDAGTDYAVAYDLCAAGAPIVVKLDVDGRAGRPLVDPTVDPLGAEPVTSVLVAYADEPAAPCAS